MLVQTMSGTNKIVLKIIFKSDIIYLFINRVSVMVNVNPALKGH